MAALDRFLSSAGTSGDNGNWTVVADSSAPSAPNVLERVPALTSDSGYHVVIMPDSVEQTNVNAGLKFKIPQGSQGQQAVGLVFRLQDQSHYFVLLADYSSQQFSLCRSDPGTMLCLVDKSANITADTWHTITAEVSSQGIAGYLDGKQLIQRYDQHYQSGTIGILAKGNSRAYFDDLTIKY